MDFLNNLLFKLRGWKTLLANVLSTIIPVVEMAGLTNVLTEQELRWYVIIMAALNIVLRLVTTTPVGKKY